MSSKGDINAQLTVFTQQLKRRQIAGSKDVALATANMLKRFVKARRWTSIEMMIDHVREVGARLAAAQPYEFTCGNVVRRVLKSIRTIDETFLLDIAANAEAGSSWHNGSGSQNISARADSPSDSRQVSVGASDIDEEQNKSASMFGLLSIGQNEGSKPSRQNGLTPSGLFASSEIRNEARDRRDAVVNEIDGLIDEITNDDPLFKSAMDMINPHEVILAPCPASKTVFDFLIRAASKKRSISVIITESYPNGVKEAQLAVQRLNAAGVSATLIPDSAVYAVMAKVSKIIISARAVLANGGCIASSGVSMACHAAKQFRKPVLIMAGSYKLSPMYPFDSESLIEVGNSGRVIDYGDAELMDKLEVLNPLYDYITPELIDIVITADGGVSPNFIYRLVLDNYSPQDQSLTTPA